MTLPNHILETLPLNVPNAYQPNDYDVEHKTVNREIPSGYASRIGYKMLQAEQEAVLEAYTLAEQTAPNSDAHAEALIELLRIKTMLRHASQTIQAIKSGVINRLDAIPDPAVIASDAFRYAVLTANAAPTLAQTDKELFELGLCPDGRIWPREGSLEAAKREEERRILRQAQQDIVDADSKAMDERIKQGRILQRRRELKRQGILHEEIPGQLEAFNGKLYEV